MKSLTEFSMYLKTQKPQLYAFIERGHWDFIFFMGRDRIPLVTVRPLTPYGNLMLDEFWLELESFVANSQGSLSRDDHLLDRN